MAETPQNFEQALGRLQQIVEELEDGSAGLDQSLLLFEQGVSLYRNCKAILDQAEQKVELLIGVSADGQPLTAAFDASATVSQSSEPAAKPRRRRSSSGSPNSGQAAADESDCGQ